MQFTNRKGRGKAVINVTPLIDVLFLLVIFVLVTARFEDVGAIPVDLPQGVSTDTVSDEPLVLSVTAEGKVFLGEKEIELENLAEELKSSATTTTSGVLVIRADRNMNWGKGVDLVEIARQAGLKRISFRTKK